jgi:hypothetical protein
VRRRLLVRRLAHAWPTAGGSAEWYPPGMSMRTMLATPSGSDSLPTRGEPSSADTDNRFAAAYAGSEA